VAGLSPRATSVPRRNHRPGDLDRQARLSDFQTVGSELLGDGALAPLMSDDQLRRAVNAANTMKGKETKDVIISVAAVRGL
jgi:hypothetical protein